MNIELLKQSPMFNLSLSSKELFHSNFIDWLITIDNQSMSSLFSNLLKKDFEILQCNREKNNFDLYIDCSGHQQIIIENKFKSIITDQQLAKYSEKLKDHNSQNVLLSLNLTDYERSLANKYSWIAVSYTELCDELQKISFKDKYHQMMVDDYCKFITEVSSYFSNKNYSRYSLDDMYSEYKKLLEIRLHDISQKILFNYILRELNIKLKKDNKSFVNGYDFSEKISSWQDFWRGTGLVSINYTIEQGKDNRSGFRLELQLQYNALKLMLIHENPKQLPDKFKNDFFTIIENLSKSKFCRKQGELFPNRKGMEYKKYGSNLIYKSIVLSKDLTMPEIINMMYESFKEIVEFGSKSEGKL
jgi:hypothetical protein